MRKDRPGSTGLQAETEVISVPECLELVATQSIGRLSIVVADEPDVFPVNFMVDSSDVVFRSAYGLKVMQAVLSRVAFEVDHLDEDRREGWSVVIKGVGQDESALFRSRSPEEQESVLFSWGDGSKDRWIRIVPRVISGRRLIHR
jgi:nitroimidazol reductase NimA-like FMN-containing flavoprotein (pyridoxamine 5'-phosphate oxidase superfamily)